MNKEKKNNVARTRIGDTVKELLELDSTKENRSISYIICDILEKYYQNNNEIKSAGDVNNANI